METPGAEEELHCVRQLPTGLRLNDTRKLETHVCSGIVDAVSQQTQTWGSVHSRQSRSDDKRHPLRASIACLRHLVEGPQDNMLLQISTEYSKWIILRKRCTNIRSMKTIRIVVP